MPSIQATQKQSPSMSDQRISSSNNSDQTPERNRSRSRLTDDTIQSFQTVMTPGPATIPIKNP